MINQENDGGPRGGAAVCLQDLTRGVETTGTKTAAWIPGVKIAGEGDGGSPKWAPLKQKAQCSVCCDVAGVGVDLPSSTATCFIPEAVHISNTNCDDRVARASTIVGISA